MMKKLLLLPLVLLLLLTACKKDEDTEPAVSELIKGRWELVSFKNVVYDAKGEKVHEAELELDISYEFTETEYRLTTSQNERTGTYRLFKKEGKQYISFADHEAGQSQIASISDTKLVIVLEYNGGGPQSQSGGRTVVTQEFKRM